MNQTIHVASANILELQNVDLQFGEFYALDKVSCAFTRGQIHGVFGRNGSGKTLLIDLIAGVRQASGGKILYNGSPVSFCTPQEAMRAGIGSVLQAESNVDTASVEDNILIHEYALKRQKFFLSSPRCRTEVCQSILDRLYIKADPSQPMATLNYGTKQLVKLARIVHSAKHYQVLVMDEPCSTCSFQDEQRFYALLEELKAAGYAVIFSSHHIKNALPYCDTVTILDDGKIAMHCPAEETSYEQILNIVCNGGVQCLSYPTINQPNNRTILTVSNISTHRVENVSFSLHKGEILGIAGLLGSGRTGIARAIAGLDRLQSGTIYMNHEELPNTKKTCPHQIGFLPSNREEYLETNFSITPNITMSNLQMVQACGVLSKKEEMLVGFNYARKLSIKEPYQNAQIQYLSAGNQKKVILSRLLFQDCKVLILDDPTVNIDIVSKNEIYNQLNTFVLQGNSIILISSDIEELKHLCKRVLITKKRTIVREIPALKLTYQDLLI